MGGEFPDSWISRIAWVFLNRVTYGTQDSLYEAIKGSQSAFSAYAGPKGLLPMQDDETPEAYAYRFFNWADIHNKAWAKVYRIVRKAYQDWLDYGANSSIDPTHGATDFRAKRPKNEINGAEEFNSWCKNNANECAHMNTAAITAKTNELVLALSYEEAMRFYPSSGYDWFKIGPITLRGVTFWLFFDDRSTRTIK